MDSNLPAWMASNLLAMASNLLAMASNLFVIASTLLAMASNLLAMASNLRAPEVEGRSGSAKSHQCDHIHVCLVPLASTLN